MPSFETNFQSSSINEVNLSTLLVPVMTRDYDMIYIHQLPEGMKGQGLTKTEPAIRS